MNRTISLPEELVKQAEDLAARERVSVEDLVAKLLLDQLAGLEYLEKRAARASREKFDAALKHIPAQEPDDNDRW